MRDFCLNFAQNNFSLYIGLMYKMPAQLIIDIFLNIKKIMPA